MDNIKKIWKIVYSYIKSNVIISTFIITSLISSTILRYTTLGVDLSPKPFFTDLAFVLIVSYFGHFFSKKNQFKYFMFWSIVVVLICIINSVYYSNYISFSSVSLIKTATELKGYTNAVFENILELNQFIYIFQIIIMNC